MTGPFTLQLQQFAAKAKDKADGVVGEVVAQVVSSVDMLSPVRSGRFRGNWQLRVGSLPSGVREKLDPTGRDTVAANLSAIPEDASGKVYFLTNNLPYAQRLEHGYSKQAPAGMVGITVTRFQDIVDDAVRAAT